MKGNSQHTAKGRQVLTETSKSNRPFVPPRLLVIESQPLIDDSEEETQLPKDQPPYIPPPSDFVPVEDIYLEERQSEDEDSVPFSVMLQRQKDKGNTKTATSSDDEDNIPMSILLHKPKKLNRDARGEIIVGEAAIGVGIAKLFEGLGMFRGIVDRVRKEGRETLYHVLYTDGDEEELSHYEYILASQLYEGRHTLDCTEGNSEMELQTTVDEGDSGSEYSDTDDRKARKHERKAMLLKRKKRRKGKMESTGKPSQTKSKRARVKEITSLDKSDIELFGGKNTLTTTTWQSLSEDQQCSTLTEMEKPIKSKLKKTLQDQLLKVIIF
jgi:hypothetical protein